MEKKEEEEIEKKEEEEIVKQRWSSTILRTKQISAHRPYVKHVIAKSLFLIRPLTHAPSNADDEREQV